MKRLGCNHGKGWVAMKTEFKKQMLCFFQLLLPSWVSDETRTQEWITTQKCQNSWLFMHTIWSKWTRIRLQQQACLEKYVSYGACCALAWMVSFFMLMDHLADRRCWDPKNDNYLEKNSLNAMTIARRYGELKRNLKLCNNDACPKEVRNLNTTLCTTKYDLIYNKGIVHNTHAI